MLAFVVVVGLALFGAIRMAVVHGEMQWLTYLLMFALFIVFYVNRERYKEKKRKSRL